MRMPAALAAIAAAVIIGAAQGAAQSPAAAQVPAAQAPPPSGLPFAAPPVDDPTSKCAPLPSAFSAQKKPRIAVMPFVNTNEEAAKQRYGASVSAMLVTFLKRKSQFVVVERDSGTLDGIAAELARVGSGATDQAASAQVQLTAFDALLQGQVTLIGDEKNPRVEVDARLLGMDAKIVSVSNKSGAIGELRSVVERLGVDLEQGFLRPYYGSLSVTIPEPTNVRVFLTPVVWECAKPDEKPPIELRGFVPSGDGAKYRRWRTQPNVASIDNLLAGWYTIRFERPGYDGVGPNSADNARLEVISNFGEPKPMTRSASGDLREPSSVQLRHLVQIKPLAVEAWPSPQQGAAQPLRKRSGSARILVKREFLDADYRDPAEIPEMLTLVESRALALNDESDLVADGDDAAAANPATPRPAKACGPYSFSQIKSGLVVVKNYHTLKPEQRELPIGAYTVSVSAPQYVVSKVDFDVQNNVPNQPVMVDLKRAVGTFRFERTGDSRPDFRLYLEGQQTRFKNAVTLDFKPATGYEIRNLPLDTYGITNDLPGFKNWKMELDLLEPPNTERLKLIDRDCDVKTPDIPDIVDPADPNYVYLVKAQPWLAGRVNSPMRSFADPNLRHHNRTSATFDRAMDVEEAETKKADPRRPAGAKEPSLLVAPVSREAGASKDDVFELLRSLLKHIDLFYLTDADTKRLAALPRVSGIVREYIQNGGSVFAMVSSAADYSGLFGASIPLGENSERDEIEIRPGSQAGLQLDVKIELAAKRQFPTVVADKKRPLTEWRVVAYRKKGQKEPAVLELGQPESGGYVLVWLDKLDDLSHPVALESLAAAEKRAIAWSQHHMFRRYGPNSVEAGTARERMNTLVFSVRREVKKGS